MGDNFFKLWRAIIRSHLKTAFGSKTDAAVNIAMMLVNNLAFFFMWWVIFKEKGTVNGWDFRDLCLMFAVTTGSFGLYAVFARGLAEIPYLIENGGFDCYLSGPRNVLFMVAVSLSTFANWGDILSSLILYFLSGYISWTSALLFIFLILMSFAMTCAFRLLLSSAAFFAGQTDNAGNNIFMSFLIFSNQPASIFHGLFKVIYLTVIPAGFIALFPVNIIKNFMWSGLFLFCAGILFFCLLSIRLFYIGLSYYNSGSRFGSR